jgi:hypothetical protein
MAQTEEIILKTTIDTGSSTESIKSVKSELRQLTNELAKLEPGSAKFVEVSQRAGQLRDRIEDANAAVKAFNPEAKFQSFATVLGGVVNGFTAIQGAMTIFGDKNKDIEQVIAKTQGAIALATGINGLMGMKDGFINLGSQLIKMIPALKSFGAAAVGALTGGIATAIILIISYWDDLKAMVTGTVEEVKLGEKEIAEARDKGHEAFKKASQERAEIAKREAQTKKEGRALDLELAAIDRKLKLEQASADGKLAEQRALIEAEYRKSVLDINKKYDKEEADRLKAKQEKEDKALLDKIQKRFDQEDKADDERLKKIIEGREKAFKKEVNDIEEQDRQRRLILAKKLTEGVITQKEYDARLVESENQKNAEIVAAGEKHYQDVSAQQKALKEAEVTAALVKKETKEQLRMKELENEQFFANSYMSILNDVASATGANAEIMKGIAIAQTTIDTYFAAQKAYTSQIVPLDPSSVVRGYIAAAVSIAGGLARVAAIARTNPRGSGGGNVPSGGGGSAPPPPMIAPASNATRLTNGNEPVITRSLDVKENRVYVLEKDITSTQGKVDNIRNQATVQ